MFTIDCETATVILRIGAARKEGDGSRGKRGERSECRMSLFSKDTTCHIKLSLFVWWRKKRRRWWEANDDTCSVQSSRLFHFLKTSSKWNIEDGRLCIYPLSLSIKQRIDKRSHYFQSPSPWSMNIICTNCGNMSRKHIWLTFFLSLLLLLYFRFPNSCPSFPHITFLAVPTFQSCFICNYDHHRQQPYLISCPFHLHQITILTHIIVHFLILLSLLIQLIQDIFNQPPRLVVVLEDLTRPLHPLVYLALLLEEITNQTG